LGISVIAEGVEDTDQLAELHRAGCGYAQGFLFSKPRPAGQRAPDGGEDVPTGRASELATPGNDAAQAVGWPAFASGSEFSSG
jgi:predicted signal transduction protein with EAL and GGDEF domain